MLELANLTQRYGTFTALDAVDFSVAAGEIVGLLGENGAGKSTLLNVIGGTLAPSSGNLLWDGKPLRLDSPRDSARVGIGIVHQHFMLVPVFTVAENMALQALQSGRGLAQFGYDEAAWIQRIEGWAQELGWSVDAAREVGELGVGERQRVEILKALYAQQADAHGGRGNVARLLLLDEPTANLTPPEVEELFAVLRRLRATGLGIVFVSHKLNEVQQLCDRVIVLRHGRVVGAMAADEAGTNELASLMVGRDFKATAPGSPGTAADGEIAIALQSVSLGQLSDFSIQVRRGEIVGLAGVDGNGQQELADLLSGLRVADNGAIRIGQYDSQIASSAGALATERALIPPDRQHVGLILSFDLTANMALHPALRRQCGGPLHFHWGRAHEQTRALMEEFDVRSPATRERTLAANLSGGNQQKLVVARALSFAHSAVVAVDPTRGVDIGATQFIHQRLSQAAQQGAAVLLVSTDLDEVLALSDRVGVLYEGRLLPDSALLPSPADRTVVGRLMGGRANLMAA